MTYSRHTFLTLIAGISLSLPFLATSFPPSLDLPQHLSQLHLIDQALNVRPESYEINWYAPGNLIFLLMWVFDLILPVEWVGRLISVFVVLAWVGAVFFVAHVRNRPAESALLASLLVFNFSFYWGFLNFQLGWPVFLLFLMQLIKPLDFRNWWATLGLLTLLYACHSFWFLLGALIVGIRALADFPDYRQVGLRLAALVPLALPAVAWFADIQRERAATAVVAGPQWLTTPADRLHTSYLVDAFFGGVQGWLEPFIFVCVFVWLIFSVISNWRNLRATVDRPLFLLACLFGAIALLAPDRYLNSILLARRFTPFALVFLLLAMPAPCQVREWLRSGFALAVLVLFSAGTAISWISYDVIELNGFRAAIDRIPRGAGRVLGLDYIQRSNFIKGRPFMQLFSYAQAYKGADLNFSFAEHGSSLVSFTPDWRAGWTGGLDWYPERVTSADLCHFDYVLINAKPAAHEHYAALPYLQALTPDGRWRLYSADNSLAAEAGVRQAGCAGQ